MQKSIINFVGILVVLFTVVAGSAHFAVGENLTREQIEYAEKVIKDRKQSLGGELMFHGKVVDFDGHPVAGAKVEMEVMFVPNSPFDLREFKQLSTVTDAAGLFFVKEEGFGLSIKNIVKEGYEYRFNYSKAFSFAFKKGREREGRGERKDQPFTFRVRKLAPASFVVLYNMTFGKKPGKPSMLDLIKRKWVHDEAHIIAMQYSSMDRDWHTDVNLSVEGEAGGMKLVLDAPDADSGFVVEKQGLFEEMTEAPEAGYRRKVEFHVRREDSPAMVYVKGQGGLFYGKIHIDFMEDRPGVVAINATAFTNLSGDRGLEYIPSIESQYDQEVYGDHTRDLVRRADLLSGKPIEMPGKLKTISR